MYSDATFGTHGQFLSWEPLLTLLLPSVVMRRSGMEEFLRKKKFRPHLPTLQCYIIELLVGIFFYVSHRVLATSSGAHVLQASLVKFHLKLQKLLC